MGVYLPNKRLPDTYQEVEYIESTGTQYLAIGNSFSTDYKVEIDVQLTATGGDQLLFGCTTGQSSVRFGINAYSSYFKTITGGSSWSNTKSEDANRHTFIMDKGTTYVDGTSYSSSYVSYTYNFGLGLFVYNRIDGGERFFAKEKLFSCKIYNGSTILYDLVPCYRKSDSVIGLYDLVNNQFYTNSGTGTFTKGPDVVMTELKNAYIGQVQQYITETYSISGGGGEKEDYTPISKSGYKVNSVKITGTGGPKNSSVYNTLFQVAISKDNSSANQTETFSLNIGSGNTSTFSGTRIRSNSSTIVESYQLSSSHINYTSNNSYVVEYTRTGYDITINGHQYSGTYSASAKSIVDTIMDSTTINFREYIHPDATIGTQTVEVVYKII